MKKNIKIVFSVLVRLLGAFLIVFGVYYDRPGAQGLGLLLILATIATAIISKKRK